MTSISSLRIMCPCGYVSDSYGLGKCQSCSRPFPPSEVEWVPTSWRERGINDDKFAKPNPPNHSVKPHAGGISYKASSPEAMISFQNLNCNCNNCIHMERDFETFKKWEETNRQYQLEVFTKKKEQAERVANECLDESGLCMENSSTPTLPIQK